MRSFPAAEHERTDAAPALSPVRNLSRTPGNTGFSQIVANGRDVLVAYEDRGLSNGFDLEIMLVVSRDEGATFERAVNLSHSPGLDDTFPVMRMSGDTIYVAWEQQMPDGPHDVFFTVSYNRGKSFSPPRNMSNSNGDSVDPHLAADGDYVYVLYEDLTGEKQGVNLARSANRGASFSDIHIHDWSLGYQADLAAAGDRVYVAWHWANWIKLYSGAYDPAAPGGYRSQIVEVADDVSYWARPSVAAAGARAHVLWRRQFSLPLSDGSSREQVYVRTSADGGETLAAPVEIGAVHSGYSNGYSTTQAIAAAGDHVWIAAELADTYPGTATPPTSALRFYGSHNGGAGYGASVALEENLADQILGNGGIRIQSNGQFVYMSWVAGGKLKVASGMNYGRDGLATNVVYEPGANPVDFGRAELAAVGTVFHLAWMDYTAGPMDIFYRSGSGDTADVAVTELSLIQAPVYPTTLAAGKPAKLRAWVRSYFGSAIQVPATIAYEDSTGRHELREDVRIEPGASVVYLPARSNAEFGGAFLRPAAGAFTVTLTLAHPLDQAPDNNSLTVSRPVQATRPQRIIYRPMGAVTETVPSCAEVTRLANASQRYLEGIYPVDERNITTTVNCVPIRLDPAHLMTTVAITATPTVTVDPQVFQKLALDATQAGADKIVGVVKKGWFNDHGMNGVLGLAPIGGTSSIADTSTTYGVPAPHEVGHNYGLIAATVPGSNGTWHMEESTKASGYWVAREEKRLGDWEFMIPYMYAGGGKPGGEHWIGNATWDVLLTQLAVPAPLPLRSARVESDGVIQVQGTITRTPTLAATFGPWYRVAGSPDTPFDAAGAYRLEYRGAADDLLAETGFDVSFAAPPDGGATGELDRAWFSLSIPDVPGTQRIVLKHGGTVLTEREVTAHAPQVTVTSPNGGELWLTGEAVTAAWTASDADGGPLSYRVSLSADAGSTWLPLATDLTTTQFSFTVPENILSEEVLLRVLASDGINTAADISDAPHFIRRTAQTAGCFVPAINVSETAGSTKVPRLATSGQHVYALAYDLTPATPGGQEVPKILFRASHDGGQSWDPAQTFLENQIDDFRMPKIAAAGPNVYITWSYYPGSVPPRVMVSHDYGHTFAPAQALDSVVSAPPGIYASGDDLYIWWLRTGVVGAVPGVLRVSHDAGATFGEPIAVLTGHPGVGEFHMAFSNGTYHALWTEAGENYAPYYRRLDNGGTQMGTPVKLGDGLGTLDELRLAVAGDAIYVTGREDAYPLDYLHFWRSADGGLSFGPDTEIDSWGFGLARPRLAVSGQNVYLFWVKWESESSPATDLYAAVSHDSGQTFAAPVRLSGTGKRSYQHAEAVLGDQVWVTWIEEPTPWPLEAPLYVRASTDAGDSFGTTRMLSPKAAVDVTMALSGETMLMAWPDRQADPHPDVLLARSTECEPSGTRLNPNPVPPKLDPPQLPASIAEGTQITVTVTAVDANFDDLIFSGAGLPPFAALDDWGSGTAVLTLAPWYGQSGVYTGARLVVSDGVYTDSLIFGITVTAGNRPPAARAGGPYLAPEGGTLHLDAGGSKDPDGDALAYTWNIRGANHTDQKVDLQFQDDWAGQAALTVTDGRGGTAGDAAFAQVYNMPPVVTVARGGTVLAAFHDPGVLDTHTATVDWGDGRGPLPATVNEVDGSGTVSATVPALRPGAREVTVTVLDKDGGQGSAQFSLTAASVYLPIVVQLR